MKRFCLLILAVWGTAGALSAQDAGSRVLETHLEKIRKEFEFRRVLSGGVLVASGTLTGVGGTLMVLGSRYSTADGYPGDDAQVVSSMISAWWLLAGTSLVPGVLTLVVKSDNETIAERFRALPEETEQERTRKILYGEIGLQSLADQARATRLLGAGLTASAGGWMVFQAIQQVTVASSMGYTGAEFSEVYQSPAFLSGAILVGLGLVQALFPTTPEIENKAYLAWKEGLQADLR